MRAVVVLAVSAGFASASHAAFVSSIPFDSATQYDNAASQTTGVFRDTLNGALVNRTSAGGEDFLRFAVTNTTNSITGISVYDTTPNNGAPVNTFLDEQVQVDFRIGIANDSFGILLRMNASGANGYLVVVNPNATGAADNFRILRGAGSNGDVVGTPAVAALATSDFITTNTWYTLVASATNVGSDVTITGAVYAQGDLSTPLQTLSGTHVSGSTAAGQVGLRYGDNHAGASTTSVIDADNFTVVPEPGSLALLAGAALLLRRRRA